jgi:hypothetical protein
MKKIKAFFNGISEFRLTCTTHYEDYDLLHCYDTGRELAHKFTLRYFEAC